ncbi:hypothetical protein E4U55_007781 [Claviceps digitariae]|nr:hypothetical protein E4U55_007781 [Claviceps digitariae]
MDQSYNTPGSVKRARQQVQGVLYREIDPSRRAPPIASAKPAETASRSRPGQPHPKSQSRPIKSRAPPNSESNLGQTISRPPQAQQWPLAVSSASPPVHTEFSSQSRSQGRPEQQMPHRPPRPSQSRIPSGLDPSRPQHPTPVFTTTRPVAPDYPQDSTVDSYDVSSPSGLSARQTTSSVGTIPDVQAPGSVASSAATVRKNAALGPPPSSRRGASSFYSSSSFVSPIAEETTRSKNQKESWRGETPRTHSPLYNEAFYEESLTEKSRESTSEDYGDETQLVRSASLGKKGKPALITTKQCGPGAVNASHETLPLQKTADNDLYLSAGTSSSETIPVSRNVPRSHRHTANGEGVSSDAILKAFAAASSSDVHESIPLADAPRQHSRMSAMRRPPRLDIDAVRAAEARGSLTSLPDLIMRATRLAAMIDKGKRPASRLDALDGGWMNEKDDRHKSGFSDMLAAFPPPVQTPRNNTGSRLSWFRSSGWPAVQGQDGATHQSQTPGQNVAKPKRRCCGLPIWAFLLSILFLLCLIAAAIVIPLEFFVFKNLGNSDKQEPSLSQCQKTLICLNGGRNLFSQGSCSCICTNGFTGPTCGDSGATGCAMTDLVSMDGQSSVQNVTLGRAIPRLIAEANHNYSLPLSGTTILARFNAANLSCIAQNSLVTFDGHSTRTGQPTDEVQNAGDEQAMPSSKRSITPRADAQENPEKAAPATPPMKGTSTTPPGMAPAIMPSSNAKSSHPPQADLPTTLVVDTSQATPVRPDAVRSAFEVTEEKVDFARAAMLYILQETSVDKAIYAQGQLQELFSKVTRSKTERGAVVSISEASHVDLGSGYSINMVDLTVDVGKGPVGHKVMRSRHVVANPW